MAKRQTTGFLDDFSPPGKDDEDEGGDFLNELKKVKEEQTSRPEVSYRPDIHFHSSESMPELDDESVHLIVTSPPYNLGWDYGGHSDEMSYRDEYMPMLARVFTECYRVLVPGGRMVVNVPSLIRDGAEGGIALAGHIETMLNGESRPFAFDYQQMDDAYKHLRVKTDWRTREIIQWVKGFNTDGLAPNGSFPRPWGILLNNMHESALVVQKPGDREYDDMSEKVIDESKINKWSDDLCDDVWEVHPDNFEFKYVDGEDVPPFPEEFVKRCIALWSYKGDTVMDPFLGRGTTCKVAKDLQRESVGYEIREDLRKDIEEYTNANNTGLDQW